MAQYEDEYEDPVKNPTKRLAAVLGKDLTGRILGVLIRESYLSASEIAGKLNIHIATAQKYLLEMKDAGLVANCLAPGSKKGDRRIGVTE